MHSEHIVKTAIEEDVDVIAMSLLNGAHLTMFPKVSSLNDNNIDDILLVGGGVILESDKTAL